MAFLETRLLNCVAMGAQGGPSFSTGIVSVRSGYESRNQNWSQARHRYDVGMVARPLSEFEEIKAAFMVVGGRANGFRFKDAGDYTVLTAAGDPQPLHGTLQVGTAGLGYGVPSYQLRKLYTTGAGSHLRDIRKPVAGTLALLRGGSPVTAGVSPGNYAVDTTTGIITFVADQTEGIASHTPGADHVFVVGSAFSPNFSIGQRVFLTGVTGTAASVLNGLSHQITNVSTTTITIATDTTGLTASGGTSYYYPQASEALAFSCEFDVPVRFNVDEFDAVIVDRQGAQGELLFQLPSIPIIEIRV